MSTLRNNRGVVLVFVAMGLLLFLLFLGLALDTGWLVYVRAQAQARVDSAALAAGAGLVERAASAREDRATGLADTFSQKNSVNTTGTPENVLVPMSYDVPPGGDGIVKNALNGEWDWGADGLNCNAVQVTTTVPTSVFFAGIRNVFGAGETGEENITVSAVSHLPCPGVKLTEVAPFALQKCPWIASGNFRTSCGRPSVVFDLALGQGTDKLAKITTSLAPIEIDSSIDLFPLSEEDFNPLPYSCGTGDVAIVPVVDRCAVVGGETAGNVVGFAAICFTVDEGVAASVTLQCAEVAPSSAGPGECFGTYASNPILIR